MNFRSPWHTHPEARICEATTEASERAKNPAPPHPDCHRRCAGRREETAMTPDQRIEIIDAVQNALWNLDGSELARVALATGMTVRELIDLGGLD